MHGDGLERKSERSKGKDLRDGILGLHQRDGSNLLMF